ncbi:MAG: permease prefix domain 1-containing protein [Victivallaceae bacterium]|nr:permease prefix domain 1-containing protein [Victivallaceae bacterium]
MDKSKTERLLDQVTSGLKADPEVRLDVKSELRSHLDAEIEAGLRTGRSEPESVDRALKSFGDPIRISDEIAAANAAKMSLKARLRLLAGGLLIPAVIVCALVSFASNGLLPGQLITLVTADGFNLRIENRDMVFWFFDRYTPEEQLILYGDRSRNSRADQQKAIWERFPDDKIYLANYALTLLAERGKSKSGQEEIFSVLNTAERNDPDNALYNYLVAGLLLEKAGKYEKIRRQNTPQGEWEFRITDRQLANRAVEEYIKGTRKKYFKTYIMALVRRRFDIMGKPRSMSENIRQIAIAADVLLPQLNCLRNIAREIWGYAETLQQEGEQQAALKIIAPWKRYLEQVTEDAGLLIDVLVDTAIAAIGEKKLPEIYRRAGKPETAEQVKRELARIVAPVNDWKKRPQSKALEPEKLIKASVLAGLLLPAIKTDFSERELAAGRKIEYLAAEKLGLMVLNMLFMIGMIGGLLTAFYWRRCSGQKAMLLTPSPDLVGKIFLMSVMLPLAAYVLISVLGFIGGHEYNIRINFPGLSAQLSLLLVVILTTIFVFIRKHIRQRCLELGVEVPAAKTDRCRQTAVIGLCSLLGLLALIPLPAFCAPGSVKYLLGAGFAVAAGLLALGVIFAAPYLSAMFSGKRYALYYGALAKTAVPVLALAMIFMTLIVMPYLDWREARLISEDRIIYGQPRSFTPVEYRVTQRLKRAMLKALDE